MKKLVPLILLLITLSHSAFGADYNHDFGKISKEELELSVYHADKEAEAVVIYDKGISYFIDDDSGFDVMYERTTRIKILSDAGLDWAKIEIPFYQEGGIYEQVKNIEAYTYNLENLQVTRTPLEKSAVFEEKLNEFWNLKKFVLPNVKKGSVIEFKYSIRSQYVFNLRDWEFQWKIPVLYSEYKTKMIPFYNYAWILQGASRFDLYNSYEASGLERQFGNISYHEYVYEFIMTNLPAFRDEDFISSINDYIIKLDFQLSKYTTYQGITTSVMSTWEGMIQDLLKHEHFGRYIKRAESQGKSLLSSEDFNNQSETEKFESIMDFVKKHYKWNGRRSKYTSDRVSKILNEKHGNSADINLLTIGLLRSAGLNAYPVILSTRDHGKIKYDYPFSHFFNYVVLMVEIDGRKTLADATDILISNYRLPVYCINDKGLIVNKGEVQWASLLKQQTSLTRTNVNIFINPGDSLDIKVTKSANEYDALDFRQMIGVDEEEIMEHLTPDTYRLIDSSFAVRNMEDINKTLILDYDLRCKIEQINNKIYISPFIDEIIGSNPLKSKERNYPVDMIYKQREVYSTEIQIPEGYEVDYVPKNFDLDGDSYMIKYTVRETDGKIYISFDYHFKEAVYSVDEYEKLRYLFRKIVKLGNEKIVLARIEENAA